MVTNVGSFGTKYFLRFVRDSFYMYQKFYTGLRCGKGGVVTPNFSLRALNLTLYIVFKCISKEEKGFGCRKSFV
jgi:hypothetical protein